MKKKYEHVDALRGIAVLLVILVHVGQKIPPTTYFKNVSYYGQYGVQLFFVMSAFTLCHSMKKITGIDRFQYLAFMTRRFFRIAPLYYLAIPFYYFVPSFLKYVGFATDPGAAQGYTWGNILANLLFLHGLYPPANNSVVPGGWTIGCEFLFYAIFPFFFMASMRRRVFLALGFIGAFIITACLFVVFSRRHDGSLLGDNAFLYYFISTQFCCFVLGMAYFFYGQASTFRIALFGLALPALLALVFLRHVREGWMLTALMAGTLAVVAALLLEQVRIPSWLRQVGVRSYSMYIIHFVLVDLAAQLFLGKAAASYCNTFTATLFFAGVAATTFFISGVTHSIIEQPFIDYGHRVAKRMQSRSPHPML